MLEKNLTNSVLKQHLSNGKKCTALTAALTDLRLFAVIITEVPFASETLHMRSSNSLRISLSSPPPIEDMMF